MRRGNLPQVRFGREQVRQTLVEAGVQLKKPVSRVPCDQYLPSTLKRVTRTREQERKREPEVRRFDYLRGLNAPPVVDREVKVGSPKGLD